MLAKSVQNSWRLVTKVAGGFGFFLGIVDGSDGCADSSVDEFGGFGDSHLFGVWGLVGLLAWEGLLSFLVIWWIFLYVLGDMVIVGVKTYKEYKEMGK